MLTLGIGANTLVFTVFDAILLRPLKYEKPEQLVQLWETRHRGLVPEKPVFLSQLRGHQTFEHSIFPPRRLLTELRNIVWKRRSRTSSKSGLPVPISSRPWACSRFSAARFTKRKISRPQPSRDPDLWRMATPVRRRPRRHRQNPGHRW